MSTEAWMAFVGIIISSVISVLIARAISMEHMHSEALKNAQWQGQITERVNAMYRIVFRTGTSEGLNSGLLNQNSPITANLQAFELHPDLLAKLRSFYEETGKNLSDLDLLIEIEKRFPQELEAFEKAHNLNPAASLAAACYLLRPNMEWFNKFKKQQ